MTLPDVVIADPPVVDNAAIPRATAKVPMRLATLGHVFYQVNVANSNAQTSRDVAMVIRPGWAQGQSMVTVATPDLASLADGPPTWPCCPTSTWPGA